jgi:hypothetical protein
MERVLGSFGDRPGSVVISGEWIFSLRLLPDLGAVRVEAWSLEPAPPTIVLTLVARPRAGAVSLSRPGGSAEEDAQVRGFCGTQFPEKRRRPQRDNYQTWLFDLTWSP